MLELIAISKHFLNIKALDKVDFSLAKGEVHALIGPNGAGKSTLMKILSGLVSPDEGSIYLNGVAVEIKSIQEARHLGISILHQEPVLVPDLSVAENIFLGIEPHYAGIITRFRQMKKESKNLLKMLGHTIHPNTMVRDLSYSQQSIVAIAKALAAKSNVLIMDEPTSCLTKVESSRLFDVLRKLKEEGVTIVFITHKVKEIIEICDRVTIMRDGHNIMTRDVGGLTEDEVVQMMLGGSFKQYFPPILDQIGNTIIEVRGFTHFPFFQNINFKLREGEILGIAGLIGSGKSELARALFGKQKGVKGEIYWRDEKIGYHKIQNSTSFRIGLVNQDRIEEGLFMNMGVRNNLTISSLDRMNRWSLLNREQETDAILDVVMDLDIKIEHIDQEVKYLSGGSQQKVTLGKWLVSNSDMYLLDEPTRGIDVGSKSEIYSYVHDLASNKKGIVIFSSEISELVQSCTRIIVMFQGSMVKELHHSEATEENIFMYATGAHERKH
jgi:ABC-type sugar transport system ATPase subunit